MYEGLSTAPIPRLRFVLRMLSHFSWSFLLVVVSLLGGMAGYRYYEQLPWRDAFLNAAMLLGGMGPVDPPASNGGKVFAGMYALYAGLVFLVVAGIMLAPLLHRILHRFHWEGEDSSPGQS